MNFFDLILYISYDFTSISSYECSLLTYTLANSNIRWTQPIHMMSGSELSASSIDIVWCLVSSSWTPADGSRQQSQIERVYIFRWLLHSHVCRQNTTARGLSKITTKTTLARLGCKIYKTSLNHTKQQLLSIGGGTRIRNALQIH